ncbi:M23 family metallopeptidase [Methanobrevibacter smithii]|uniref:M23 family metallopeptidase n=1 Tax=Methanobrevibacter smithii TaxID=2173 RepID=UPI00206289FA|nr:MAG TPA: peptidase [Caudoviricetes sp.]
MNSPYNGNFKVTQEYKGASHDGLDLVGIDSKEIHSTVNGVVEFAGWENSNNHSQGFGQYVKIIDNKTGYGFYFGHLSTIKVKVGQSVKITDVIGIEGNTGNSTGSHCHYCIRKNGKGTHIDVSNYSGIPNKLGTYNDGYITNSSTTKTDTIELKVNGKTVYKN